MQELSGKVVKEEDARLSTNAYCLRAGRLTDVKVEEECKGRILSPLRGFRELLDWKKNASVITTIGHRIVSASFRLEEECKSKIFSAVSENVKFHRYFDLEEECKRPQDEPGTYRISGYNEF